MLTNELVGLLNEREFISVATCDFSGRPNSAPKFLLKAEAECLYLIDYTIGQTYKNLKANPRASISAVNAKTLIGYQINGSVNILDKGHKYDLLCEETADKKVRLTAKHIIEDVRGESSHDSFEVVITDKFVIFEFVIDEVVEMGIDGNFKRTKKTLNKKLKALFERRAI